MSSVDQAYETQLKNIQTKTGKTLDQLYALIKKSGLTKHGEIRDMLKRDLGLGHGDANTLTHFYLKRGGPQARRSATPDDVLAEIYSGPKAELRPIHDKLHGRHRQIRAVRDRSEERPTSACAARNSSP